MKNLKSFISPFIVIMLVLVSPGCNNSTTVAIKVQSIVDSIALQYIPDKRTELSEIHVIQTVDRKLLIKGESSVPALKNEIINALDKRYNNLIDSIIILPDTVLNKKSFGLVNLSVVNMRGRPAHSAEMVSQAILGTPVKILKSESSWYFIQTPDNYLGWVEEASIIPVDKTKFEEWRNSMRVLFIPNTGIIYSDPEMKGIVSDVVAGCILVKKGEERGMVRIEFPDGREGYIPGKEVTDFGKWKQDVTCTEDNIVKSAGRLNGLPYLWGGTSAKGVDCSGFAKTVYFLNGIILQRDASQQALHGDTVEIRSGYEKLRPGDLLFFGSVKGGRKKVTHVAIYLDNKEYINSSGRVMKSSLDPAISDYNSREQSLLVARRIIGVVNDPGIVPVKDHPWY